MKNSFCTESTAKYLNNLAVKNFVVVEAGIQRPRHDATPVKSSAPCHA